MGRLRGAPGIVNVLLGAQVLGALRCAFGRALRRDDATAKSPAPAYGACRWCLHAPYASKLLAHKGVFRLQVSFSSSFTQEMGVRRYSTAAGAHFLLLYLPSQTHAIRSRCLADILGPSSHTSASRRDIISLAHHATT